MATGARRDLRVVLLLRAGRTPAWVAELAKILLAQDGFTVSAILAPEGSDVRSTKHPPAPKLWERLAGASPRRGLGWGTSDRDPFASVDITRVVPALRVDMLQAGRSSPTSMEFDVAVAADCSLAREDHAARGLHLRFGAWYSPQLDRLDGPVGSWAPGEVARWRGLDHLNVSVRSVTGPSGAERLVMAADVPLESVSAERNRAEAAWGAATLMVAALERARGDRRAASGGLPASRPPGGSRPDKGTRGDVTSVATCRPRMTSHASRVAAAAGRRIALKRQWLLAYHFGDAHSLAPTDDTRLVVPPADRYWADPHAVFSGGEYHVFFEELPFRSGRGHIATMRLGEAGPLGESRVVLASDHHLSYPFVFAFDGEWYMIPESAAARRIDLFRAEEFPFRWTLAATLMDDVSAVDTTLVEHDGRWWLFTAIRRLGGDLPLSHLYLFSARSPLSRVWEPHPMNPIASGAVGARSAGGITTRNGRLVRPSQDSRESYGGRIELYEILTMTRDEYRERPAGTLEPTRKCGFVGLHTVSQVRDLTVVDLCRWIPRF